jgi:hypothetical protein
MTGTPEIWLEKCLDEAGGKSFITQGISKKNRKKKPPESGGFFLW